MANQAYDARMLFFMVSIEGDGMKVDGGWNSFYDSLPKEKKKAAWYAAMEALCAVGAQMVGDDDLFQQIAAEFNRAKSS